MLLVLLVDLSAEHVEAGAGAGVVVCYGLIKGDLRCRQLRVHGLDARGVGDAEQVSIAYGEDNQIACIFCGEFGALEVVFRSDVILQCGDVDQVLSEVGTEVDDLKGSDDGIPKAARLIC